MQLNTSYLKQYGITIPKNARYTIDYDDKTDLITIEDNKFNVKRFYPYEFIMYTGGFNDEVLKYPGYVHMSVYYLTMKR